MRIINQDVLGNRIDNLDISKTLIYKLDRFFYVNKDENAQWLEVSGGTNLISLPSIYKTIYSYDLNKNYLRDYTGPLGDTLLRETIKLYESVNFGDLFLKSRDVYITVGAGDALNIIFSYLQSKELHNVLILGPQYPIIYKSISMNQMVFNELIGTEENSFLPQYDTIEQVIRNGDYDCLYMTQPNNPSGGNYKIDDLRKIIDLAKEQNIMLVFEKVASDYLFNDDYYPFTDFDTLDSDKLIVIDSLSKRRSLSGLKVGYIIGNKLDLKRYIESYNYGSCPPTVGERGIVIELYLSFLIYCMENNCDCNEYYYYNRLKEQIVEGIDVNTLVSQYRAELYKMRKTIVGNKNFFESYLKEYIVDTTTLSSGFNYLVCFNIKNGMKERKIASSIFRESRVANYPFGCFIIDKEISDLYEDSDHIWIRISLALSKEIFENVSICLNKAFQKLANDVHLRK